MNKDILFQRVLEGKCPISGKFITEQDETVIVEYGEAKLKVKSKYVRFNIDR